ncbi:hypothetical protein ERJ75_001129400 [Trypanosoma vivax]|nr:hypothetical protein ERJ75_001129400 [Trypanosoma vivax]
MVGEVGKKRLLALIAFFCVAALGCRQVAAGDAKGLTLAGAKSVCALALALEAAGRAHEIAANEATAKAAAAAEWTAAAASAASDTGAANGTVLTQASETQRLAARVLSAAQARAAQARTLAARTADFIKLFATYSGKSVSGGKLCIERAVGAEATTEAEPDGDYIFDKQLKDCALAEEATKALAAQVLEGVKLTQRKTAFASGGAKDLATALQPVDLNSQLTTGGAATNGVGYPLTTYRAHTSETNGGVIETGTSGSHAARKVDWASMWAMTPAGTSNAGVDGATSFAATNTAAKTLQDIASRANAMAKAYRALQQHCKQNKQCDTPSELHKEELRREAEAMQRDVEAQRTAGPSTEAAQRTQDGGGSANTRAYDAATRQPQKKQEARSAEEMCTHRGGQWHPETQECAGKGTTDTARQLKHALLAAACAARLA